MKTNKYVAFILIAMVVAVAIFSATSFFGAPKIDKENPQMPPPVQKQKISAPTPSSTSNLPSEKLEPMTSSGKSGVDSEIKAIDKDINSLKDETIDDISGIENDI